VPPDSRWWEETEASAKAMEAITVSGGRLVVAFAPTRTAKGDESVMSILQNGPPSEDEEEDKETDDDEAGMPVDLRETWEVDLDKPKPVSEDGMEDMRELVATVARTGDLPDNLDWHSIAYFLPKSDTWKTVYECEGRPVVVERALGKGTLVLLSDSFLFSNEAMRKGPPAQLLAWLMGPNERVVFDEVHLGVLEQEGVMTLARKYRLHGFAAGLAVLVVLFLWKNMVRLTPPYDDEFDRSAWYSKGKEAAEGLTNLLRRSVAPRDVLRTCLGEWKRAVAMRRPESQKKLEKMQAIVDANAPGNASPQDVVLAYREMARIATERK
jgi:hypothetical protein